MSEAANPGVVAVHELAVQGAHGTLPARLYCLATACASRASGLIVFFHQGSFVAGNLDEVDGFMRALVERTGHRVLSSSYTLAGEQPFPAAAEDAHAVLLWAAKQRRKIGWDGTQMIVAGLEAGGNLAAVASLMARDRGGPAIAGQILLMPMLDPGLTSCSMRSLPQDRGVAGVADACAAGYRGYLQNASDRIHPYASPLQSSRLRHLPSALILSAEDDPLRDEAEQYAAKLDACGVKTRLRRLPPMPLQKPDARCECACRGMVLDEITAFIGTLAMQV